MSDFKAKMHQIRTSAGTPPQTPLGELTDPLAEFKGPNSKGREGRGRPAGARSPALAKDRSAQSSTGVLSMDPARGLPSPRLLVLIFSSSSFL